VAQGMSALSHMGEQYRNTARQLEKLIGREETLRLIEIALFRDAIVLDDGREITGPALIRRMAQERYGDVFRDQVRRKMHDAGAIGEAYLAALDGPDSLN
ncbi:hypothetical protein, partial [Novosphingobium sp. 11B]